MIDNSSDGQGQTVETTSRAPRKKRKEKIERKKTYGDVEKQARACRPIYAETTRARTLPEPNPSISTPVPETPPDNNSSPESELPRLKPA